MNSPDTAGVCEIISENDGMFAADRTRYLVWGEMGLRAVRLALLAAEKNSPRRILDFPCGHGRVLRFLRAAYPDAEITACDLDRDGVDFCAKTLGAIPVYSHTDPGLVDPGRSYDLIWVGSLFTHLPPARWQSFLHAFSSWLAPGGLIVFSTHGRAVVNRVRSGKVKFPTLGPGGQDALIADFEATGFAFRQYVNGREYGVSMASPAWVCSELQKVPALRLVQLCERGWYDHHDIVACERENET